MGKNRAREEAKIEMEDGTAMTRVDEQEIYSQKTRLEVES
jgi:hypothetical protein